MNYIKIKKETDEKAIVKIVYSELGYQQLPIEHRQNIHLAGGVL